MIGHTTQRTSEIWFEFSPGVKSATLSYRNINSVNIQNKVELSLSGEEFNTGKFLLTNLQPANRYIYKVSIDKPGTLIVTDTITTQQLWQWRKPAPDFSFPPEVARISMNHYMIYQENLMEKILPYLNQWPKKMPLLPFGLEITGTLERLTLQVIGDWHTGRRGTEVWVFWKTS
jgi:hypothetical protein